MAVAAITLLTSTSVVIIWVSTLTIPDLKSIENRKILESTKIYDRTGQVLLYDVHENVKRKIVPFNEISRNVKNATVAIEDAEFYEHNGVRLISFLRAVIANITTGSFSQGGSTITQQVVKNSILTTEKLISRKIKEWVLALKLERMYSKEEILALYLKEAPYGGSIYGIEEASQSFFGKSAKDATIAEAAYLAALPNAPTYYSPYGPNKSKLEERKNLILYKMYENGFINAKEYSDSSGQKVDFLPQEEKGIRAPHFVFFIKSYLEEKYGRQFVEEQGLKVTTTLDYALQQKAEETVKEYSAKNKDLFDAENASLVGIKPATGEILVMVGSRDYFDRDIDGNYNVALAKRQPGSTFKPFVYATAFSKGYLPQTNVFDVKTEFSVECGPDSNPKFPTAKCYSPENYDLVYRGPISLRNALAQSINIPAIKTLYLAGLRDSLTTAKDMGITTLTDIDRYGLTLVLGGGEVTLLELTSAYGVFANNGLRAPYTGIIKIEDGAGNLIEELKPSAVPVIAEDISEKINDILSDNQARTPAFGANSPLYFPGRDVAAKTGTTDDYKDAWIIGYTPDFVLGAWVGNNDNRPMVKKVASFIVAPMWNAFMSEVLNELPDKKFPRVADTNDPLLNPAIRGFWQGGQTYTIDKISGKLATSLTPEETRTEKVVRNIHTILYWISKNDPLGERPENPERDSQFTSWEYAVQNWVKTQGIVNEDPDVVIPKTADDIHTPDKSPKINITSPVGDITYPNNSKVLVAVKSNGIYPPIRMDVFINGTYVGSARSQPFEYLVSLNETPTLRPENEARVVVYDSVYNKSEAFINFKISTD